MRPETRQLVFDLTVEEVSARLNLSARAVAACVEHGLLSAILVPRRGVGEPQLSDARFRGDQVSRLVGVSGELEEIRAEHPRRTRGYDRAIALGALLSHLRLT